MPWNTPTVRGMIEQVNRLVAIETEAMFMARKKKLAEHRAVRPPLVMSHSPPTSTPAQPHTVT
uniref:Uncharacterized protein n=1 Tax=Kalanchoe fedtschenkoi TaxID=63787 RepID=A0A7N0RJW6_KALFE